MVERAAKHTKTSSITDLKTYQISRDNYLEVKY